jgi:hypothetical protein
MKKKVKLAGFVFDVTMSPDTEFITIKRDRAIEAVDFINEQLERLSKVGRKRKYATDAEKSKAWRERKFRDKQKPSK